MNTSNYIHHVVHSIQCAIPREIKIYVSSFHLLFRSVLGALDATDSCQKEMRRLLAQYQIPLLPLSEEYDREDDNVEIQAAPPSIDLTAIIADSKTKLEKQIAQGGLASEKHNTSGDLTEKELRALHHVIGGILECGRKEGVWSYWLSYIPDNSYYKYDDMFSVRLPSGVLFQCSLDFTTYWCLPADDTTEDLTEEAIQDYTFLTATLPGYTSL